MTLTNGKTSLLTDRFSANRLGDFFSRLVAWALPVTYFLVTVAFYLRTYDSAQIKITFTQVGCGAVILFWSLQLLFQKRWPFEKKDLPIVAPFLASLASGITSYAQSSFREGSLDEFSRRVFYVFMALIVIAEFRGMDRQRRLLRWLVAAFAVTVFYGFLQYFDNRLFPAGMGTQGLDPFIWRQAFSQRVFSSFGNPNFFGNFLVIITPILIALFYKNGGRPFRPFFLLGVLVPLVILADKMFLNQFGGITSANQLWVSLALVVVLGAAVGLVWWRTSSASASGMLIFFGATFINVFATETKGAWVGFLGAVAASAILVGVFLLGPRARRVTFACTALIAFLGFGAVWYYAMKRKQSVDFRVFTWIGTWEMIRQQPFFGTGIGSFKWAYPAYRRPEIILLEGRSNTETDHAENEYLEVWFDEGVIGFGIFLWLIISVSVMGVRALHRLTLHGPRPPPGPAYEDRVYKILAYLGAWWGALLHWCMDVSVRFVSSGIYSLLLPALVTSFVRNDPNPSQQDEPHSSDRWLRLGFTGLLMAFFLWARVSPEGVLFCGSLLIVLGEILEWRLRPQSPGRAALSYGIAGALCLVAEIFAARNFMEYSSGHALRLLGAVGFLGAAWILKSGRDSTVRTAPATPGSAPVAPWQAVGAAFLISAFVYGCTVWRGYFLGDVGHNVAIFFSKQQIWLRSPEFDGKVNAPGYPADMKSAYAEVGGAIDHYERTTKLNPGFPMPRYFIGNVYNDWGSSIFEEAKQARARGETAAAETLRERAETYWRRSLSAYDRVKAFAPNYVQTHHQVGLIYLKLADMETVWGRKDKAEPYWQDALKNFALYRQLDPVFPPNYYRTSYVHYMRGDFDKAEKDYLDALTYNTKNVVGRVYHDRNAETFNNLGRFHYIQLVNRYPTADRLPASDPSFLRAADYYQKSLDAARSAGQEEEIGFDSAKSLAVLYARGGQNQQAQALWLKLRQWRPTDPDVQRVFASPAVDRRK